MLIVDVENAPVVCGSPVAARSFTLLDDLIDSLQRRLEVGALPSQRRNTRHEAEGGGTHWRSGTNFEAARPVLAALTSQPFDVAEPQPLITVPSTRTVAHLFNMGYEVLLQTLTRSFTHTHENPEQRTVRSTRKSDGPSRDRDGRIAHRDRRGTSASRRGPRGYGACSIGAAEHTPQDGRMASDLLREAGRQSEAKPVCPSTLRVDPDGDHIVLSREEGLAERRLRAIREVAGSMPGVTSLVTSTGCATSGADRS